MVRVCLIIHLTSITLEAKTILLIEDNPMMRENTAEILELANYRILTAENGKEGVQIHPVQAGLDNLRYYDARA
jgi:CheY-like chemotaxis protein